MLFPNHPAYAEIRAGMGYQPGAHALLGYSAPYHGMGDFSPSMEQAALSDGIAQSDLDLLNELGATDQDLENLINGNVTLSQLYAQYGVTISPSSTATANAPTGSVSQPVYTGATQGPQAAAAGQVPTGSQINYVAGWTPIHGNADSGEVQAALAQQLPRWGMQLTSYNATGASLLGMGTTGFTASIAVTGSGFALLSDAQSILVTIVQSVIGTGNLTTNQASVVSTPSTPAGTAQPASTASSAITWVENNALYIGAAVAALILLNNFTGKRR